MTDGRRQLGFAGEDAAAAWYVDRGYEVVARNWRCRDGEIDLIVRSGRTVVFCEVKARSSTRFGSPFEAVTGAKQQRIRGLAACWLEAHRVGDHHRQVRFDVAGVTNGVHVDVLEGAF